MFCHILVENKPKKKMECVLKKCYDFTIMELGSCKNSHVGRHFHLYTCNSHTYGTGAWLLN